MKFTVFAVVVLAVVACAHCSVIQLVSSGLVLPRLTEQTVNVNGIEGVALSGAPAGLVAVAPTLLAGNPWAPAVVSASSLPAAVQLVPGTVQSIQVAPAAAVQLAPAAVQVAPAVVSAPLVAAEGSYVAQNRGAVHVAPLPGHSQSAASINLEPAPGTL